MPYATWGVLHGGALIPVYAPVVSYDTFRTCLSIAAATDAEILQADIKNAYLVGEGGGRD